MNLDKLKLELKDKPTVSKAQLFDILNKMKLHYASEAAAEGKVFNVGKVYKPDTIKKYDVVSGMVQGLPHPCVVFKVNKDKSKVYAFSLSTTMNPASVHPCSNTRFFKTSNFTNTVITLTMSEAISNFVGIYENKADARVAFGKIEAFYKELFTK